MPFESEAQRRYLWANHPEVAELFAKHTPKGTKLPARKSHPQLLADLPPKTAALSPLQLGNQPIVIDRPAGFRKTFPTPAGPMEREYPVDYGYFHGITNPDDGEDADVFFGQGGSNYGRFMKGKNLSGQWEPDERKWYAGLTDEQLAAVKDLFESQSQGLLQDFVTFPDHTQLLADLPSKTAALSPLLTKVVSQYASLTPVHRAMQTPMPAITQPMLVKALRPGNIPPTPGLQASQIGGTAKTANTHLSERAQLAPSTFEILAEAFQARHAQNLKEAALKPPMPKMPNSLFPQFPQQSPTQPQGPLTQIPKILGIDVQQQAQTGSQKPHNAKSVYGAGPLSNTGIAGVGVNLNPVTAGLAMRKGANWDEKLARLIARRGEADPLRPWLSGKGGQADAFTQLAEAFDSYLQPTPSGSQTGGHGAHTHDSHVGEKVAADDFWTPALESAQQFLAPAAAGGLAENARASRWSQATANATAQAKRTARAGEIAAVNKEIPLQRRDMARTHGDLAVARRTSIHARGAEGPALDEAAKRAFERARTIPLLEDKQVIQQQALKGLQSRLPGGMDPYSGLSKFLRNAPGRVRQGLEQVNQLPEQLGNQLAKIPQPAPAAPSLLSQATSAYGSLPTAARYGIPLAAGAAGLYGLHSMLRKPKKKEHEKAAGLTDLLPESVQTYGRDLVHSLGQKAGQGLISTGKWVGQNPDLALAGIGAAGGGFIGHGIAQIVNESKQEQNDLSQMDEMDRAWERHGLPQELPAEEVTRLNQMFDEQDDQRARANTQNRLIGALTGALAGGGLGYTRGRGIKNRPQPATQSWDRPEDLTNAPLDVLKQIVQQGGGLHMPDKPYAAPLTISTP